MKKFNEWMTVKESDNEHIVIDSQKSEFISNKAADVYAKIEKVHQSFKQAHFDQGMSSSNLQQITMIFNEIKNEISQIDQVINQL